MKRIAHLSDLHLGRNRSAELAARRLATALEKDAPCAIVVSGDVTHRGLLAEQQLFNDIFQNFAERLFVVPGNHDRLGENAGRAFMQERVSISHTPGVSIVRVDSTGPHNRSLFTPQGEFLPEDLQRLDVALDSLPKNALRIVVMHHHPLALPPDDVWENLGDWLGFTRAEHLHSGDSLLSLLVGRCDLVLHGHRHRAYRHSVSSAAGDLEIVSGGSSTELCSYRILSFAGQALVGAEWTGAAAPAPMAATLPTRAAFRRPAGTAGSLRLA